MALGARSGSAHSRTQVQNYRGVSSWQRTRVSGEKVQYSATGYHSMLQAVSWQWRRTYSLEPEVKPGNFWSQGGHRPKSGAVTETHFWPLFLPKAARCLSSPYRTCLRQPSSSQVGPSAWAIYMWVMDTLISVLSVPVSSDMYHASHTTLRLDCHKRWESWNREY